MMEKHSLEVLGKRRYAGVHRKKNGGFCWKNPTRETSSNIRFFF